MADRELHQDPHRRLRDSNFELHVQVRMLWELAAAMKKFRCCHSFCFIGSRRIDMHAQGMGVCLASILTSERRVFPFSLFVDILFLFIICELYYTLVRNCN